MDAVSRASTIVASHCSLNSDGARPPARSVPWQLAQCSAYSAVAGFAPPRPPPCAGAAWPGAPAGPAADAWVAARAPVRETASTSAMLRTVAAAATVARRRLLVVVIVTHRPERRTSSDEDAAPCNRNCVIRHAAITLRPMLNTSASKQIQRQGDTIMPWRQRSTSRRLRRHFASTCLASVVLVAGVVLPAMQTPLGPQLTGEAPPPATPLSLWYRAPASDHPFDPARSSGQGSGAEWVRALPVGNGRLGAMIFGGVVHERLQLNEDTLWAGRPYDPVNPDAKDALPQVRRLLAMGLYPDAARLVSQKVMAKPLAQMPYQTLGDLTLTFPGIDTVEHYRRDLDLTTATAHVSYVAGGVRFEREVFASAPDQTI